MNRSENEDDLRIITSVQTGDQQAFAELYDKHGGWMLGVAVRILQNQRDAEDLLHDVFVEIWHKAGTFNAKRGNLKSWLAVKLRSRAIDRLRALSSVKQHIDSEQHPEDTQEKVSHDPATAHDHSQAVLYMQHLPTTQRTVLELSYFRGYTCQEIANYCQLPLGTVKSGIQRGIQTLRQQLNSQEVTETCP